MASRSVSVTKLSPLSANSSGRAFSSAVRHFREGWTPATQENLREARRFVQNLRANGGTNIEGALSAVTDVPETDERLSLIVFLTDGLPSVGEQRPDQLAELAAARRGDHRTPGGADHRVDDLQKCIMILEQR